MVLRHSRESGNPEKVDRLKGWALDSRFRGNDEWAFEFDEKMMGNVMFSLRFPFNEGLTGLNDGEINRHHGGCKGAFLFADLCETGFF